MLRSFFTITFRILWRNKVTSFVNIFGLSVGMTAFIFIMMYVKHELSYDKEHVNYDRVYRLEGDEYAILPPVFGSHLSEKLPEIEAIALLIRYLPRIFTYAPAGNPESEKQLEIQSVYADSTMLKVFSFSFIEGDPKTALRQPMTVVLTESVSKNLFGNESPIGKVIKFQIYLFTVTGIIQDMGPSHIELGALLSMASFYSSNPGLDINNQSWAWSPTYLLMKNRVDKEVVENKINSVLSEINDGKLVKLDFKRFHLRPMSELYFNGEAPKLSYGVHGNLKAVLILVAIGIFILVLAGINYVNLTTARSAVRSKEIALKRLSGSSANLLRVQLIGESIMLSLVSLVVALTLIQLFLPSINLLTGVKIEVSDLNQLNVWAEILGGGVLIGILAGLYPAFYLTGIQPVKLIKGVAMSGSNGNFFKNGLITFQFSLSIILIVSIIVNFRQLDFMRTADMGFDKEKLIVVRTSANGISREQTRALRMTFKDRLLQFPEVENVSNTMGYPGQDGDFDNTPILEINGIQSSVKYFAVDEEYLSVSGIDLIEGRNLTTDRRDALVNESMVREFNLESPIGMILQIDTNQIEIVGVVKDFHIRSLHDKIEPLMLVSSFGFPRFRANIRVNTSDMAATLKKIEQEKRNLWPSEPFVFEILDDAFDRKYLQDEKLAKAIGYFTVLAITIACLGLFALSSFMVSRRVKEIGVRKTLGASVSTIFSMLSWDFIKWILVAIVIATPVAWYLMKMWLSTFAYHIELGIDVFVIAALIAIGIALLTVTGQSLKVAKANPIDSLRYE